MERERPKTPREGIAILSLAERRIEATIFFNGVRKLRQAVANRHQEAERIGYMAEDHNVPNSPLSPGALNDLRSRNDKLCP